MRWRDCIRGAWVAILLGTAQLYAQPAPVAAGLDSIARAALLEMNIPGMSIAVVKGSDTLLMRGYGYADLENDVIASPQTVYRIASITKQFTAAAVLRLAEEGKLSVDDTLRKFLPDYDTQGNRVTIRQLLDHTSGIRSYTSIGPRWERLNRLDIEPDSMIALFSSEPFDFEPGTDWSYNNSGYYLLGVIIEQQSGKKYGEYIHDEFMAPLGMNSSYYCDTARLIKNRAAGYHPNGDGDWENAEPMSMSHPFAAGALCSTVRDLVIWTSALMGGRVITPASLAQMLTPGTLTNGDSLTYAFGVFVNHLEDRQEISHTGGINGFTSALAYYPADTLTIALLINSDAANPTLLQRKLARHVLGLPDFKAKDLRLTQAEIARYEGSYRDGDDIIEVLSEGGNLFWRQQSSTRPERLRSEGNGVFVPADNNEVRVIFLPADARAERLVVTYVGQKFVEAVRVVRSPPQRAR